MSQPSKKGAVVIDANVSIAICAKEQNMRATAENALADYSAKGWAFYAPSIIVSEVMYVLCQKLQDGLLTPALYEKAVENFRDQAINLLPPPSGEASLIKRAKEIRQGYGCSCSSDSLYIALAEELAISGNAEILTFDKGFINQVANSAPTVNVNLLPV